MRDIERPWGLLCASHRLEAVLGFWRSLVMWPEIRDGTQKLCQPAVACANWAMRQDLHLPLVPLKSTRGDLEEILLQLRDGQADPNGMNIFLGTQ